MLPGRSAAGRRQPAAAAVQAAIGLDRHQTAVAVDHQRREHRQQGVACSSRAAERAQRGLPVSVQPAAKPAAFGGRPCPFRPPEPAAALTHVAKGVRTFHPLELVPRKTRVLCEDPPIFLCEDFLSAADCAALVTAAQVGALQPEDYRDGVEFDLTRLAALVPLCAAAGALPAMHAFEASHSLAGAVGAWGQASTVFAAGAAVLAVAVREALRQRKTFTGTKWVVPSRAESATGIAKEARRAEARFLEACTTLCALDEGNAGRFERVLVTRYRDGEQQRKHEDARLPGDSDVRGSEEFLAAGGQRLAQIVCYLAEPEAGGATKFHHPLLQGLEVEPVQGAALVFFPAFRDGDPVSACSATRTHAGD